MNAADQTLAEEQLRELRAMLELAIKDGRSVDFISVLRARIADLELEMAR